LRFAFFATFFFRFAFAMFSSWLISLVESFGLRPPSQVAAACLDEVGDAGCAGFVVPDFMLCVVDNTANDSTLRLPFECLSLFDIIVSDETRSRITYLAETRNFPLEFAESSR